MRIDAPGNLELAESARCRWHCVAGTSELHCNQCARQSYVFSLFDVALWLQRIASVLVVVAWGCIVLLPYDVCEFSDHFM